MPIHDLWHFENSPQGLNLSVAAYATTYNNNTIYNQYTGNTGQPMSYGANAFTVTSDGFLSITSNASGQQGAMVVPCNAVQDWSVATQYWVGFRTKMIVANASTTPLFFGITSNTSWSSYTAILNETQLISAGLVAVGVEHYVEVFLDRVALTFQAYVDGALINSGTLTSGVFAAASYLYFGGIAAGTANYARGYRDFYFLDVDAVKTPNRLGPIRAKVATITAATASEYTPQGAASLLAALNTPMAAPPVATPNVLSSTDGQPLVQQLSTSFLDSQYSILGVQPMASYASSGGGPPTLAASFTDNNGGNVSAGSFAQAAAGPFYNQKLPLVQTGPNGSKWTAAEINISQYLLAPQ